MRALNSFLLRRTPRLLTFSANMSLSGSNTLMSVTTLIDSKPRGNKLHAYRMNCGPGRSLMGRKTQALSRRDYSCNH